MCTYICTVKPVLKDHPIGHTNVVSREVVFGDRFNYIECWTFCQKYLASRQVVSQCSGLSRYVSLYVCYRSCYCYIISHRTSHWLNAPTANSRYTPSLTVIDALAAPFK